LVKNKRGFVLLYFLFFMPVLVAMLAWTVDLTRLRLVRNQLWAACDAAAHAGVAEAELIPGQVDYRTSDTNGDGRPDVVDVTVRWYRLVLNEGRAKQAAWDTFYRNVWERGWVIDGISRDGSTARGVSVFSTDFFGQVGSSTGRMDVRQDEYTVSARAVVKTFFTGWAVDLGRTFFQRYGGPPVLDPVTENRLRRGEVTVSATATARVKISGVQIGP
jgi:hypothetical protein